VELTDFQARFAAVLRRRRLRARLTQEGLSERAGLHRTHVSVLERGRQVPNMAAVLKIAAALGTSLADLFEEVESDRPPGEEPPEMPKGRPRKEDKARSGRGAKRRP
jgi:transcriptional regulator with XRE-family HTH domain